MDTENASAESQRSFESPSYDSSSLNKERDETYSTLQNKLIELLKAQKRNEKLRQQREEAKKKLEQYKNKIKELQKSLFEICHNLNLPENSQILQIIEKINSLNKNNSLIKEINDIIEIPNNSSNQTMLSQIKDNKLFLQSISEIIGKNKNTTELINEVKQLKKDQENTEIQLKNLGTNNFEYLIENQKDDEKKQKEICSLLDINFDSNTNIRHNNIITAINELKRKPFNILNDLAQLISPSNSEKVEDVQDVKNLINDLKQKVTSLSSELNNNKKRLGDFHISNVDEAATIISDLLATFDIKSPAMIQNEVTKTISEKEELKEKNHKVEEELEKLKLKLISKEKEFEENQYKISDLQQKFNEQVSLLKSDLIKSESKNKELTSEMNDYKNQIEKLNAQLTNSQKEKEKSESIQRILNVDDPNKVTARIQKMLLEEEDLRNSNEELLKERQATAKLLKIGNESSISEAVSDLIETISEQKAENQDLSQKISAVASFLNIPNPQSVTLSMIQKAIRNLQKDSEATQNEKLKLKNENDSLNQKYDVLLDTQNEIQKALNMNDFRSSSELIQAVSENERLLDKICKKLKVNRDELFEKVCSNNEIVNQLCNELRADESNLVKSVIKKTKSVEKAAEILNTSGSSIERAIEENSDFVSSVCKILKCSKENVEDILGRNCKVLNELLKNSECNQINQLVDEFCNLKETINRSKKELNDLMRLVRVNSVEKIAPMITNLQDEAEKTSALEKKLNQLSEILKVPNSDNVKESVQDLLSENKRLNDSLSKIQTIINSDDIMNSITLMSTVLNSIQKMLPNPTDITEIPTLIAHYQNDSESYQKIKEKFPSTDPFAEISNIQKEMNEIYSIFNLKKFDDPIEIIKLNNNFVKSIADIVNEFRPKGKEIPLNSGNSQEIIGIVQKTFSERKEIMSILNTSSPINAIKNLLEKENEISQIINLNSDEEQKSAIQKVVGLKDSLSSLLDVNDVSDIFTTVQKQKQTNKDLFDILNIEDPNKLLSKAKELAIAEKMLKKICPDENDLKEIISKIENENKEMTDFISKVSTILSSSGSSNSSSSSSPNSKNSSTNYKHMLKKIEKLTKSVNEISKLLNCTESSIVDQVTDLKKDFDTLNEIFNSEVNSNDGSKIIQMAKKDKQILKALAQAVDADKNSEILEKVNQYKHEINELKEKLNQTGKFQSKLNGILSGSQSDSNYSASSIEKKAEEVMSKMNKFNDLISLMNCDENEANSLVSSLLKSTKSSSFKDISNFISSLQEKIERLTQKSQKDNSFLSEFLNEGEMKGQLMNSDNLVQLALNKFRQKTSSLEDQLSNFNRECNRHANIIKNTNNKNYSFDEISSIFRSHEDQLKEMRSLFNNGSESSEYREFSTMVQKVEQMKIKLKETAIQLNQCQHLLNQKNFELKEILSACNVSSPEFAIDIIKSLKQQISELNKEVAELKTCQTVEQSFKMLEKKQDLSLVASRLSEINGLLHNLLSSIENGKTQKAEMKKLIEGVLFESITLRESLEANEEKWMLFGSKKKQVKKPSLSDEIRSRKKELNDKKRKVEKTEETVQIQKHQNQHPQVQQNCQPQTLI